LVSVYFRTCKGVSLVVNRRRSQKIALFIKKGWPQKPYADTQTVPSYPSDFRPQASDFCISGWSLEILL
jgi:hypothetical protein